MQVLTIEFSDQTVMNAIKDLESRNLIRIVKEPELNLLAIPGEPISEQQFNDWISSAENSNILTYSEAKKRWAQQKEKIQKLIP